MFGGNSWFLHEMHVRGCVVHGGVGTLIKVSHPVAVLSTKAPSTALTLAVTLAIRSMQKTSGSLSPNNFIFIQKLNIYNMF